MAKSTWQINYWITIWQLKKKHQSPEVMGTRKFQFTAKSVQNAINVIT